MLSRRLLIATLAATLLWGGAAEAAKPATTAASKRRKRTSKRRKAKNPTGGPKRGATRPASSQAVPLPALTWLRGQLAAAQKTGKGSDLATLLLTGVLEGALPQALHTHYALSGLGKALRKGAMDSDVVAGMAADMAGNLRNGARTYRALGAHKAFGQLAGTFAAFAALSGQGAAAADALAAWAKGRGTPAAFDKALEAYRAAVDAFNAQLRGGR